VAAGLVAAGLLSLTPPAEAQLSETGGPISYSADSLEYYEGERRLVLTGAVDVLQGDARLRADRLTLYFSPGSGGDESTGFGSGDIERMVASGNVFYVRPLQQARGDTAVYETGRDTVTFTGNVIVASDDNVIRGDTLVLQISARRTTVSGSEPGQRVRGVVNPDQRPRN
jgi:lipopolysaccharide export system protein LptA